MKSSGKRKGESVCLGSRGVYESVREREGIESIECIRCGLHVDGQQQEWEGQKFVRGEGGGSYVGEARESLVSDLQVCFVRIVHVLGRELH